MARRQQSRYEQQADAQAYEQQQAYPPQQPYAAPHPAPAPAPAAPSTGISEASFDELTKLAALHDQGVLTDEEFAAGKAKILGL